MILLALCLKDKLCKEPLLRKCISCSCRFLYLIKKEATTKGIEKGNMRTRKFFHEFRVKNNLLSKLIRMFYTRDISFIITLLLLLSILFHLLFF